jgi:hypothetical protein
VSRRRRRAAAGRPPTEFTVRHRDSSRNSCNNPECPELGGFREVESPNAIRFGRGLRRRTPPRGGGTKIDTRRGCAERGIRGEPPKSAKSGFSPPAKNPNRVPAQGSRRRTPGVGARRGAKRLSPPTRRGRSAGERKSENRGKTGKNGVFRRRFEKTSGDTGRNDVRRTRPEATDASARSASIGARRAKSEVRKTDGKKSKTGRFGGNLRNRRRTGRRRRRATKLGGRTRRGVGREACKISSRSEERFGRGGRPRGTTRRPRREATERPIDAGRRRTRRRRGTDARNSRQYGERRVGETEQKKIAKIGEGVRKLSTIWRASKSGFVRRRPSART